MTAPGLPTIEQVREHAERHPCEDGGLWRVNTPQAAPEYVVLRLDDDGEILCAYPDCDPWYPSACPWGADATWTPCDRDGNPLEMVEEIERLRKKADGHGCELRALEDEHTGEVLRMQHRIDELDAAARAAVKNALDAAVMRPSPVISIPSRCPHCNQAIEPPAGVLEALQRGKEQKP